MKSIKLATLAVTLVMACTVGLSDKQMPQLQSVNDQPGLSLRQSFAQMQTN